MKKFIYITIVAVAVSVLPSCEKELDFKYIDIDPITVIEGELTETGAKVRITRTTPMDEPMDTEPLTGANVMLADLTTGEQVVLAPDSIGDYVADAGGIPGHSYELTVDHAGKRYIASGLMGQPVQITNLEFNWINMPYDQVAVLQVTFTDASAIAGDCYWVRLYRNGEAYMWNLVTDIYATAGFINDVFMTSRRDLDAEDDATALRDGDVMTASVAPVSRRMFDYLEAVSSDSNGPALFDGDFCLGYFLPAPVAVGSVVFRPDEIAEY